MSYQDELFNEYLQKIEAVGFYSEDKLDTLDCVLRYRTLVPHINHYLDIDEIHHISFYANKDKAPLAVFDSTNSLNRFSIRDFDIHTLTWQICTILTITSYHLIFEYGQAHKIKRARSVPRPQHVMACDRAEEFIRDLEKSVLENYNEINLQLVAHLRDGNMSTKRTKLVPAQGDFWFAKGTYAIFTTKEIEMWGHKPTKQEKELL
jgi:hypothetical protein